MFENPTTRRIFLQRGLTMLAVGLPMGLEYLRGSGAISPGLARLLGRGSLAAVLVGELWLYGAGFNPTGPLADLYAPTALTDALKGGPAAGSGRVLPINRRWSLDASLPLLFASRGQAGPDVVFRLACFQEECRLQIRQRLRQFVDTGTPIDGNFFRIGTVQDRLGLVHRQQRAHTLGRSELLQGPFFELRFVD